MIKTITKDELIDIITAVSEKTEITMETSTPLKMNKGGRKGIPANPYLDKDITEHATRKYLIGESYENLVNEALQEHVGEDAKEFKGGALTWGKWKVAGLIIEHGSNFYLRCYAGETLEFRKELNGEPIDEKTEKELAAYLPKAGTSKKQGDAGLDKDVQVHPLAINFDNIISVEIGQILYKIK